MNYKISWLIDRMVMMLTYRGDVTLEIMIEANEAVAAYLEQGNAPVHIIVDLSQVVSLPAKLMEIIGNAQLRKGFTHPSLGWVIYIGSQNNPFYNLITSVIAQEFDFRVRWLASLEGAIFFLKDIDDTPEIQTYPLN